MRRLLILGASGHGRVVADIARLQGYEDIAFLDDDPSIAECGGWPVVGRCADAGAAGCDLFVAVGDATARKGLMEDLPLENLPVLVHPSAVIARDAAIGAGSVVMAGAVVNPGARIGRGCIVNTCASVDHDCTLGDYCHVAVGAHLCGGVRIGEGVWIGAGTTVINNVSVCSGALVGAGATVVRDLVARGTYVGVPAKAMATMGERYSGATN